ncbi:MAG: hypothetical protein ACJ749_17875 [Flavisolibacter sp.]
MKAILILFFAVALFSCKRKWTENDKSEFLGGCLKTAIRDMGEDKAKPYCSCLLQKIVQKYPNANDAKYIRYDSTNRQLAKDCLNQP